MKLRYTPEAIQNLREIQNYIRKTLKNPQAAARIGKMILDSCSQLKKYPMSGLSLEEKTGYGTDLRMLVCENYLAIYKIGENEISVTRIIDGRQDYISDLFD